jgi:glycine cleavage system H protein
MSNSFYVDEYLFLKDLYYTNRHIWVKKEPDELFVLGLDDLGQKLAGKIKFVRLKSEGSGIKQNRVFGTMESMKWIERLLSPITGIITKINSNLQKKPTLINEDPYGDGWMIKIKPTGNVNKELNSLNHGNNLLNWIKKEIDEKVKGKE